MEKADFGTRFFAWLIDIMAMSLLSWIVGLLLSACASFALSADSDMLALIAGLTAFLTFFILLFFQFFYFGYFWSKNGQSVGMRLLNIKTLRRDGGTMSFFRAGFRGTLGYWISGLLFGLGYLWAAFDADKEAWHDKLFDTAVLKA